MILIGLGANLSGEHGSPEQCLYACALLLADRGINITASSNIWKSAPVPVSDQPWYKNAVCRVNTNLNAHELLNILSQIENEAGRVRTAQNAARVLDLDVLSYNSEHINDERISIPHPRLHERAFVLYPLHEIAPNWIHPELNKSVDNMIEDLPKWQEIERMPNTNILSARRAA